MRRLHLVEPVVGVYAFALFMAYPLLQQYIYRRMWEEVTATPYTSSLNFTHCADGNSNVSRLHEVVQKRATLFFLYSELCYLFPSLLMSLALVSFSDRYGRRLAIATPLVGDFLFSLTYFLVSRYALSLRLVLAAAFAAGLTGGPMALIGGSFAYVADLCAGAGGGGGGRKTVRMAVLDTLLGLLSGLGSFCTGFFIRAAGVSWPFLAAALLHLLNLAYASFVLAETVEPPAAAPAEGGGGGGWRAKREVLATRVRAAYLLFAASTRRRNALLVLVLLAFAFYKVAKMGGMSLFILYELNAPLCWSEVLVGYASALSAAVYVGSFAGVYVLSRCLHDVHISLLGLLSVAVGMAMAAFAKTTLMMFLVRVPLLFSIMPAPVLRSMMSKMVLSSEQGALFGCVAFVEMLSLGVAVTVFHTTYAHTVSWFSGFSFLMASGLTLIPMALSGSLLCLRPDDEGETRALTGEEEETVAPGDTSLPMPSWDGT